MIKIRILLVLFVIFGLGLVSKAQMNLTDKVPVDPNLRTGKLSNGMTYYIRHNKEPKERASYYIIQNVGALLENDSQNGLAHFLEHMAFNGTQHFEGKGILNTLQKHGVAFGRNINAYTSFLETVYNLSEVPTTKPGLIDTCLLILNDWSHFLSLTDTEIDAERGVITEEWRTRRNSSFRLREQFFPVLFKGSKYAVRDVIGNLDVIKTFPYDTLRKFYHDWYRTDLQAIAIVGDINVDEVEGKVKELFSKIEPVKDPIKREPFAIPSHDSTYYVLATDKEATQSQVMMYIMMPNKDEEEKTLNDMRESYIQSLYNTIFGLRIEELLQKGQPPFINGYNQITGFVSGYDAYVIGANAKPNEDAKAFEAIMVETERVRRYGVTSSELERAKTNILTNWDSRYKEKDKIKNDSYCREYSGNFTQKEPIPGIDFEYNFAKQVVPTITADEINAMVKKWIGKANRTIIVTGPSENVTHLTEAEANAIIEKVEKMVIEPYKDAASGTELITEKLKGSKIVSTKKLTEFDAVEWTLANNTKVVYRRADYEKDQVTLKAYSNGGTSLFENDFVPSFSMTSELINAYGVGNFDAIALQKMLTGKKVSLSPFINDLSEGFSGSTTPKDFETMMQLLYLYFEKPRFDVEAHDAMLARYKAYIVNLQKDPRKIMQDSISNIMSSYNPRNRNLDSTFLSEVSLAKIEKVYRDRIQDVGDFTFFIVGNIGEDTVKTMVEKYIGSLADNKRTETWKDRGVRPPVGKINKEIELSLTTPKTTVVVSYTNDFKFSPYNSMMINIIKGVLDLRYTENIREKEGGTYGVSVSSGIDHFPVEKAKVSMMFDCDPDRAEKLKSIVYQQIDSLINDGPSAEDFDKTVKNLKKDREQAKEHNNFWMNSMYTFYYHGVNTASPKNFEEILEKLTRADVQKAAKEFFSTANVVDLQFKPKP